MANEANEDEFRGAHRQADRQTDRQTGQDRALNETRDWRCGMDDHHQSATEQGQEGEEESIARGGGGDK